MSNNEPLPPSSYKKGAFRRPTTTKASRSTTASTTTTGTGSTSHEERKEKQQQRRRAKEKYKRERRKRHRESAIIAASESAAVAANMETGSELMSDLLARLYDPSIVRRFERANANAFIESSSSSSITVDGGLTSIPWKLNIQDNNVNNIEEEGKPVNLNYPSWSYLDLRRTQNTSWATSRLEEGVRLAKDSKYRQAEKCYREGLDLLSTHAELWVAYGCLCANTGRVKEGTDKLERALVEDPNCSNAQTYLDTIRRQSSSSTSGSATKQLTEQMYGLTNATTTTNGGERVVGAPLLPTKKTALANRSETALQDALAERAFLQQGTSTTSTTLTTCRSDHVDDRADQSHQKDTHAIKERRKEDKYPTLYSDDEEEPANRPQTTSGTDRSIAYDHRTKEKRRTKKHTRKQSQTERQGAKEGASTTLRSDKKGSNLQSDSSSSISYQERRRRRTHKHSSSRKSEFGRVFVENEKEYEKDKCEDDPNVLSDHSASSDRRTWKKRRTEKHIIDPKRNSNSEHTIEQLNKHKEKQEIHPSVRSEEVETTVRSGSLHRTSDSVHVAEQPKEKKEKEKECKEEKYSRLSSDEEDTGFQSDISSSYHRKKRQRRHKHKHGRRKSDNKKKEKNSKEDQHQHPTLPSDEEDASSHSSSSTSYYRKKRRQKHKYRHRRNSSGSQRRHRKHRRRSISDSSDSEPLSHKDVKSHRRRRRDKQRRREVRSPSLPKDELSICSTDEKCRSRPKINPDSENGSPNKSPVDKTKHDDDHKKKELPEN